MGWKPALPWPIAVGWTAIWIVAEVEMIRFYGPMHLLWLSHIAFALSVVAIWLRSRLLASVIAVGVALAEIAWVLDFLPGLLIGHSVTGATDYMFDPDKVFAVRLWSGIFHVPLPAIIIALIWRLGYDARALWIQTALVWLVFPIGWLFGSERNINWTWSLGGFELGLPPALYLVAWMLIYPLVAHLPAHLILRRWSRSRGNGGVGGPPAT